MATVFTIGIQKGGVGKTTTTFNLGTYLAAAGKRTLLIDLDPQHSLTKVAGLDPDTIKSGTHTLLRDGKSEVWKMGDLGVIPTNRSLAAVSLEVAAKFSNRALKKALVQFDSDYDYILLDCAPGLDSLVANALAASRWLIVPCATQYLSVEGLSQILDTLAVIREEVNPQLDLLFVLPTMYNSGRSHDAAALELLKENFGDKCASPVPYRVEYANAGAEHRPVSGDQAGLWRALATRVVEAAGGK